MDFFSILLPGALLTYLLMVKVGPVVLGIAMPSSAAYKAGRLPVRELSLRPPGLPAWLLAGRVL
jgi:hypothetical protein